MEKLTRDNFYPQISYVLLLAAVATVSWTRFLMLPIAILLLILFVADNRSRLHFHTLKSNWLLLPFFVTLSLFLLSLIGAAYSDNIAKAISDWECKLWFLVAPLCLLPLYDKITLKQIRILLIVFILSASATAIGNFVISSVRYAITGDLSQLFYLNATHFFGLKPTHPSYLSMYYTIAWIISIILLTEKADPLARPLRAALLASLVVLPMEIILLQSKAGVLIFAVVLLCAAIRVVRKRIVPLWAAAAVLIGCIVFAFVFISGKTGSTNRLGDLRQHRDSPEIANPYSGTLQRIVVWETSCELAADNLPFGTGTGDITDELCKRYETKGYTYILRKKLNCHNQYLQHLVGLGIPGLLALLLFLGLPLWEAIRQRDFLQGMWWLLVAGNLLVESMLETRAGSNFIPLMTGLLLLHGRAKRSAEAAPPNSR